jgi:rare lipoprotein A
MSVSPPICRQLSRAARLAVSCFAMLPVLPLLFTGCHKSKSTYDASASLPAPPPPPPIDAPEARPTPHPRTVTPGPTRKPEPAESGDALGRPVSIEVGLASWYGPPYHNRQAADGSIFDQNALTAAHRELPMGTMVRVTNLATNESVLVKITDRGPFVTNRILDLSLAAAKSIDVYRAGVARVRVEAFPHATADPAGRWCVQIGAFLTQDDAVQMKNDLASRYTAAKVIWFQGPTGFWVRINPTQADRTTASRIVASIHIPDADPYLVRLN